jgi:hypothetical protein
VAVVAAAPGFGSNHHYQSSQAVHAATPLLSCLIGGIDHRGAVLKCELSPTRVQPELGFSFTFDR